MRKVSILTLSLLFSFFTGLSQDGEGATTGVSVGIIHVKDSIFMMKGKGGNIGVSVGEDGVLMIDNQFAEATPMILNRLSGLSNKPVQFLINTHHHGDHTGGNKNMNDAGVTIVSHDNVRSRLKNQEIAKANEKMEAEFEKQREKLSKDGNNEEAESRAKEELGEIDKYMNHDNIYPTITFSEDITFHYNGEKIMIFHVENAHTDGDAIIYFTDSNVLHTGDVFFNGRYPYIDTKSGGSLNGYIKALSKLMMFIDDETKIIPGHGDIGTKADVKLSHDMLVRLRDGVAIEYGTQKSLEQVLANKELTKFYDDRGFGEGYVSTERFITMMYEIAKKRFGSWDQKKGKQ
ncbi:MAG: MBL fold metallo-hydrolase [Flavobacteriaceae bacterium]|nr:MBL fold metallo-hydrolase [Flavobacteriaceae bacterium]